MAVSLAYEIVLRPQAEFNTQYQRFMSSDVVPKIVFIGDSRLVWGLHHGAMDRNFLITPNLERHPTVRSYAPATSYAKPSVRVLVMQIDPYVVAGQRSFRPLPDSRGFYEALLFSTIGDIEAVVAPSRQELLREIAAFAFPMWLWWERVEFWGAIRQALTALGFDSAKPLAH